MADADRVAPGRHPTAWVGAGWTWWAMRHLRRSLGSDGVSSRRPPSNSLPGAATTGVAWMLERLNATCLERSLIWQSRALARSGTAPDVVIGVRVGDVGDLAHAWLDGEAVTGYAEIHRLTARP